MKVFCINDCGWIKAGGDDHQVNYDGPVYGETYIVVDVQVFKNVRYYVLENWPGHQFLAAAFIPIQDIEEENEELIPISEIHKQSPWPVDKAIKRNI